MPYTALDTLVTFKEPTKIYGMTLQSMNPHIGTKVALSGGTLKATQIEYFAPLVPDHLTHQTTNVGQVITITLHCEEC